MTVRRYDTTSEQEKQIMNRMEEIGGGSGISCTRDVSEAVAGIGPFEKVESTLLPSAFDRHLEAHPTYVQKYRPGEQTSGPANGSLKKIILDSLKQQVPAKYML